MKALTIRQPFASLLLLGPKRFETRDWATLYRGKVAIHAAKTYDRADRACTEELRRWPELCDILDDLPLGVMLGIANLAAIYRTEDVRPTLDDLVLAMGDYRDERAAWDMPVVEVFDQPVPVDGALGLWEWVQEADDGAG